MYQSLAAVICDYIYGTKTPSTLNSVHVAVETELAANHSTSIYNNAVISIDHMEKKGMLMKMNLLKTSGLIILC